MIDMAFYVLGVIGCMAGIVVGVVVVGGFIFTVITNGRYS